MRSVNHLIAVIAVLICAACTDPGADTSQTKAAAIPTESDTQSSESPVAQELPNCPDANACLPTRSSSRWGLLIEGKPELAYAYLSPDYRAIQNNADYVNEMRNRPVTWVAFEYINHKCDSADSCNVTVQVDSRLHMPKSQDVETRSQLNEHWVRSGGNWYFLPEPRR